MEEAFRIIALMTVGILLGIFLAGVVAGIVLGRVWEYVTCRILKIGYLAHIKGLHFHRSLFTFMALVLAVYVSQFSPAYFVFLLGSSLGIILEHTFSCGFKFITKD